MIDVKKVSFVYKNKKKALEDVSFHVEKGEIVALLGPNGAGKSTLVKLILGLMKPTAGEITVSSKKSENLGGEDFKKIGVIFGGKSTLLRHLPAKDSIKLSASIYGVKKKEYKERLAYYAKKMQVEDLLDRQVLTLSFGQRIRIELLAQLIFQPKILILDEPTIGLDIEGKRQLRSILSQLSKESNLTVLLTTHDVNDVEKFCDKAIVINQGKTVTKYSFKDIMFLRTQNKIIEIEDHLDIPYLRLISDDHINRYIFNIENENQLLEILSTQKKIFNLSSPTLEDMLYEYYR